MTLGVLEAGVSEEVAFSSPPFSGANVSRRTEKANGLGAKSAQSFAKTFEDSRPVDPTCDCEPSGEGAAWEAASTDGIRVLRRQRGQRIVRPAKCEATVSSERQDSQENVIFIIPNFKRVSA